MEALCSPYDSLLVTLGTDDSNKAWGSALRNFCSSNADTTCMPLEGKDLFLKGLRTKINEISCSRLETDLVFITELCDCVRIAVRDKSHTEVLTCDKFIGDILSFAEYDQADVSRMALRCLINLINENCPAFEIFLGESVNGLKRVIEVLRHRTNGDECHQVKFLVTKLLYMVLSQRTHTVGPLLRTREAEAVILEQLSLCVSIRHHKALLKMIHTQNDHNLSETEILSESEINLELSTGLSSSTGVEMPPTGSSGNALGTDCEAESSGTGQSGRIRKNWGALFTETCKLLYALYSGDKYEYEGMEQFLCGQRIFLVYNILSEIIVAPHSQEANSAVARYEDDITQSSCRRHALQLAMLSLDLDAMTQQSSIAPAISSSVPLMLKILIANGGVKALCCLLQEYFTQLPLRGTSIPFTPPPVALLSPVLVILIRIATSSSSGRAELKASIFPNPWKTDSEDDLEETEEVKSDYLQQKMDPTDIPSGTLRAHLINMMTSLDDVLKRYCAELLYELCDKETGEFVSRTGFGNAIALMQIKGLI